jgi:antirestriction protein ArdC
LTVPPGAESYYSTKFHELTHWTRHPLRLAREFGRKRWGDEGYAAEDHASYIANWLELCSPRHNLSNREALIM